MDGGILMGSMTVEELWQRIKNGDSIIVLDVRDEEKYQSGSLRAEGIQLLNIPYVALRDDEKDAWKQVGLLPQSTEIITVCTTGNKAQKAAQLLREKGVAAVSLEGGLTAWNDKQSPSP
jgi:rhodanese-related sulfurtransferase